MKDRNHIITQFQKFDDPDNWECPEKFDRENEMRRFLDFHKELERVTGKSFVFETEDSIQDATFHSQIDIGEYNWLRFSNFGSMISIFQDDEIDIDLMKIIKQIALEKDYNYVPGVCTNEKYSGDKTDRSRIEDWWIRYFDWI